ncbi:MAG: 2Fe-2S iron-sulfur cluster-binding protein, partial [Myxococcales bacterium]|nr:2Fe-2S iron-sulfur cluster-binding protein [Myxococcales bacterium]
MSLEITINGSALVVDEADPHLSLLSFLRELGLTGAKEGCGEGECGACAVVMIRPSLDPSSGRQSRYVAVNSCLIPLPSMHGHEIITVEGLASEAGLHPVQEVMIQEGASQCGYCTPGFVMSLFAARYEDPEGTLDPGALAGNLCRCTGYRSILDAARALPLPAADDPFLRRLEEPAPEPGALEYEAEGARFLRPTRLAELLEQLAVHPEATLLAGGSDRMVEITQHAARFSTLISVEGVDELRIFEFSEEGIEIGAALSLSEVEAKLASRLPILDELFRL